MRYWNAKVNTLAEPITRSITHFFIPILILTLAPQHLNDRIAITTVAATVEVNSCLRPKGVPA